MRNVNESGLSEGKLRLIQGDLDEERFGCVQSLQTYNFGEWVTVSEMRVQGKAKRGITRCRDAKVVDRSQGWESHLYLNCEMEAKKHWKRHEVGDVS